MRQNTATEFYSAADKFQIEAMRLADLGDPAAGKALICATLSAGYRQAGAILDAAAQL
jgi:hypothetical protein